MIGSPTIDYWHNKTEKDELWEKVVTHLEKDAMITSGSFTGTGSDQDQNEMGISYNHAYSVHKAFVNSKGVRLI
jgi:hypothetical protein